MAEQFAFPEVVPYRYYPDATEALAFLCRAFGFEEHSAVRDDDGLVWNAQLRVGRSGLVMIGPAMAEFGSTTVPDASVSVERVHVLVEDVDAHHHRAAAAGATIMTPPEDHGPVRIYIATDCGGHQWIFAQPLEAL